MCALYQRGAQSFEELQNTHWAENRLGNNKKAIVNYSPFAGGKTTTTVGCLDQCLQHAQQQDKSASGNLVIIVAPSKALGKNFIVTAQSTSWIARTDGNGDMQVIVPKFVGRWPNYNIEKGRGRRKRLVKIWAKYSPDPKKVIGDKFDANNYLDWENYYLSWNTSSEKDNVKKNSDFHSWVHEPSTEYREGYYRENVSKPSILFCDVESYSKIIQSFRKNMREHPSLTDKRRIFSVFVFSFGGERGKWHSRRPTSRQASP